MYVFQGLTYRVSVQMLNASASRKTIFDTSRPARKTWRRRTTRQSGQPMRMKDIGKRIFRGSSRYSPTPYREGTYPDTHLRHTEKVRIQILTYAIQRRYVSRYSPTPYRRGTCQILTYAIQRRYVPGPEGTLKIIHLLGFLFPFEQSLSNPCGLGV